MGDSICQAAYMDIYSSLHKALDLANLNLQAS